MKKLLLSFFVLLHLSALPQAYNKTLGNFNEWHFVQNILLVFMQQNGTPSPMTTSVYPFPDFYGEMDSVYNTKTYKKLSQFTGNNPNFWGLIREDSAARKIWYIPDADSTEVLLYDFSMNPGDSINIIFPWGFGSFQSGWYKLDSVVTKNIFAGARKHFYLSNPLNSTNIGGYPRVLEWIESVGSTIHLLYPYLGNYDSYGAFSINCNYYYESGLQCKSTDSSRYYFNNCFYTDFAQFSSCGPWDSCHYTLCGGIETNSFVHSITIFPQPATSKISLSFESQKTASIDIEIADLSGKKILASKNEKIIEGENTIDLDVSSFSAGFYFATIYSRDRSSSVRIKFMKTD